MAFTQEEEIAFINMAYEVAECYHGIYKDLKTLIDMDILTPESLTISLPQHCICTLCELKAVDPSNRPPAFSVWTGMPLMNPAIYNLTPPAGYDYFAGDQEFPFSGTLVGFTRSDSHIEMLCIDGESNHTKRFQVAEDVVRQHTPLGPYNFTAWLEICPCNITVQAFESIVISFEIGRF